MLYKNPALKFIILLGIISLLADITYEGARSITGPYLAFLSANALTVGFVAGFGELIGYGLRFISGYLADRTGKYWAITIIGYVLNLLAVPLLALSGYWWIAAALMIIERAGKAIRTPPRDAMLSHAGQQTGLGWAFGLHEALDQIGAQESLMRAIVAQMTPKDKRATAYGIFNMGFGIAWFFGSVLMGALYDISITALIIFSVSIQLLAIPFLLVVRKMKY